jgi:hypothetical protein
MKHKTLLISSALLMGSLCISTPVIYAQAATAEQSAETAKLLEQAIQTSRRNNVEQSRAAFDSVLQRNDITSAQRYQIHMEMARVYLSKRQYKDAFKEYDLALAEAGNDSTKLLATLTGKGNAEFSQQFAANAPEYTYRDTHLDLALECFQKALALPGIANSSKVQLLGKIANCYLEKKDPETANRYLQQAIALPNLDEIDLQAAKLQYARALARQLRAEEARVLFDEVLATNKLPKGENLNRILARERILLEDSMDAGIAFLRTQGWSDSKILSELFGNGGSIVEARVALARKILADASVTDTKQVLAAYQHVMDYLLVNDELEQAQALFNKYPSDISSASAFDRYTKETPFRLWIGEALLQRELSPADQIKANRHLLVGARVTHQPAKAEAAIRSLLDLDQKMKPEDRQSLQAELLILQAGNNPDRAALAIAGMLQKEESLDIRAQMALMLLAGRHAMTWRNYDVAERLLDDHNKLVADNPTPSIPVAYIPNGPQSIDGFMQSDWFKNVNNRAILDRPYRGDLKLLAETDTASVGRVLTQSDGSSVQLDTTTGFGANIKQDPVQQLDTYTSFVASCDQNGVYLFFYIPVEEQRLQQLRGGFGRIGSFESYLGEGFFDPYTCMIFNPAPEALARSDGAKFPSQYPNRHWRPKVWGQNMTYESKIVDGGVAALLFFDWDGFLRLPKNGDKWNFEVIHFERGGWTWGGSRSVHWKDTMGDLVFENMTPENRTAIQRRLLSKAKAAYEQEKSARNNGYIEFWMDNQLGDQQFYDIAVAPFVAKADAYASRIKANMTDQEVNEIFDAAYLILLQSRFEIEELRREYMLDQLTAANNQ